MGLVLQADGFDDFNISHHGHTVENIRNSKGDFVVTCEACGSKVFNIAKKRFHFTCVECGVVKKTIGGWSIAPQLRVCNA